MSGVCTAEDGKKTYVLESPNAVKHMDALFEVIKRRCRPETPDESSRYVSEDSAASTKLLDALFEVIHSKQETSSGDTEQKANAKSWKDRKLPPSFFDAGSVDRGLEKAPTAAPDSPEPEEIPEEVPSSSSVTSTDTTGVNQCQPMVIVAKRDCLTYCIE